MISRQMGATESVCNGPWLAAFKPSITCASRSGRKTTEPSFFLTSPTAWASVARLLSSASSSRSTASIWARSTRSSESGELSAMANGKFSHVVHQRTHAFHGHGVVEAGAHSAHALVALELQQPSFAGAAEE